MKKLFKVVAVAVLSLGLGVAAQAQVRDADIKAKATVVDQLVVTPLEDLDFGIVMQGKNKMVAANGGVTSQDGATVSPDASVGQFSVLAGAGSSVTIRIDVPLTLAGPAGSTPMPIVFNRDLDDAADATTVGFGYSTASLTKLIVNEDNSITIPSGENDKVNGKSGVFVWLGGVVKPSANQVNGAYSGDITLTASYN